jgi:glutathione S-transferase
MEATMKLFYMPGACSLAPHILLRELNLPFDLERVSHSDKSNLIKYNSKGHVPTLLLEDGQVLTEAAVILQYLADKKPEANLIPRAGTFDRYRVQEWLNYLSTEVHKSFAPLFGMKEWFDESHLDLFRQKIENEMKWLDDQMKGKNYLLGDSLSVADFYCFVLLSWSKHVKVDLSIAPNILGYLERMGNRPTVKAAQEAEKASAKGA